MPPVSSCSAAHSISATAASTSLRKICAMPARRPGVSAQKSTIQRLCAFSPAHRNSYSSAAGGRASRFPDGKKGGIVFGKSTSATTPSSSSSRNRAALSQLRYAKSARRSSNGFANAASHASNSSWYFDSR
jgi:hypothetical protein